MSPQRSPSAQRNFWAGCVESSAVRLMFALLACVASLALVAAGCGGDDDDSSASGTTTAEETSTEEWASSVSAAVTTWENDLDEAAQPLLDLSSFSEETIRQAVDDVETATQTLADSLKGLGRPGTSSGEQVESAVGDFTSELENSANQIETAVEGFRASPTPRKPSARSRPHSPP